MDSVVLKGRNDSLALHLQDTADFTQIIQTLKTLLGKLYEETPTGDVSYRLETGNRLLTEEQLAQIQAVFEVIFAFLFSRQSNFASDLRVKALRSWLFASSDTHR